MSIQAKLTDAKIRYRVEPFLNNFYGTRFVYPNKKEAMRAEQLLGYIAHKNIDKSGEWWMEFYI